MSIYIRIILLTIFCVGVVVAFFSQGVTIEAIIFVIMAVAFYVFTMLKWSREL